MPRSLEMLDHVQRQLGRGKISALEAIDVLLGEELSLHKGRRVKTALKMGRLLTIKTLGGFDFSFQRSLDRGRIMAIAQLDFIDRHEVVHFLGQPGCGKTHIAIALAVEAVQTGRSVYFTTLAELVGSLAEAEREGTLRKHTFRPALLGTSAVALTPRSDGPKGHPPVRRSPAEAVDLALDGTLHFRGLDQIIDRSGGDAADGAPRWS